MLGFDGDAGELVIGEDNEIFEHVSIHVGLPEHGGRTQLGDRNLIQGNFHIAHDCRIGNHCVLAGFSGIGGHVVVEDFAVIGAMSGIHQFVRIGESGFTAGNSMVSKDVAPFAKVAGDRASFVGVNRINLERRGFEEERIRDHQARLPRALPIASSASRKPVEQVESESRRLPGRRPAARSSSVPRSAASSAEPWRTPRARCWA